MPGPVIANGASFSRRAGLAHGAHGVGADEAGVLLAAPAEAGLDRAALLHQVVAVEVEAHLQAQRVARAQPGRLGAAGHDRVPDRRGVLARRRSARRRPRPCSRCRTRARRARRRRSCVAVRKRFGSSPSASAATIPRACGPCTASIARSCRRSRSVTSKPSAWRRNQARSRSWLEALVTVRKPSAEAVGEEVVEHPAVLAAQHAVLRAVGGELGDVVGEDPLQERLGVGPGRLDLAHVRDVEDAGALAHGLVLGADPAVLDRHLPAREGNEPRAGRHVAVVQRGALEGLGAGGHPGWTLAAESRGHYPPPGVPRGERCGRHGSDWRDWRRRRSSPPGGCPRGHLRRGHLQRAGGGRRQPLVDADYTALGKARRAPRCTTSSTTAPAHRAGWSPTPTTATRSTATRRSSPAACGGSPRRPARRSPTSRSGATRVKFRTAEDNPPGDPDEGDIWLTGGQQENGNVDRRRVRRDVQARRRARGRTASTAPTASTPPRQASYDLSATRSSGAPTAWRSAAAGASTASRRRT